MAEHEWLEVLLYGIIARRNTNELAHLLLQRFGSVLGVFSASMEELCSVKGVGQKVAAYLRSVGWFFERYRATEPKKYHEKFDPRSFLSYVNENYQGIETEVLDLYLLDGNGLVIDRRRFSVEHLYAVRVVPEDVSSFLLQSEGSGVVMVHNHPCGEAFPSDADDRMTKNCQLLCSMHNRLLCDHVIYAPDGVYSYYLSERLREISHRYSIENFRARKEAET